VRPDDKICYCYGVPLRKLEHFARLRKPRRASQMSECFGAGTGCGWCIPTLIKIFEAWRAGQQTCIDTRPGDYEAARGRYIQTRQPRNTFADSADTLPAAADPQTD